MIKAVIFDCFGVLAVGSYVVFRDRYLRNDKDLLRAFHEIDRKSSLGEMTLDQVNAKLADLAGISKEEADSVLNSVPRNDPLFEFIEHDLKPKYKIGFLSNIAQDATAEIFSKDDLSLFDDILLSCDVGLAKPDPDIFNLAARRLGITPEECLFTDDLERHIRGAKSVGMHTILFNSTEQFKREFSRMINDI
jgi:epoxide hydrolase-like predicted phosphatase